MIVPTGTSQKACGLFSGTQQQRVRKPPPRDSLNPSKTLSWSCLCYQSCSVISWYRDSSQSYPNSSFGKTTLTRTSNSPSSACVSPLREPADALASPGAQQGGQLCDQQAVGWVLRSALDGKEGGELEAPGHPRPGSHWFPFLACPKDPWSIRRPAGTDRGIGSLHKKQRSHGEEQGECFWIQSASPKMAISGFLWKAATQRELRGSYHFPAGAASALWGRPREPACPAAARLPDREARPTGRPQNPPESCLYTYRWALRLGRGARTHTDSSDVEECGFTWPAWEAVHPCWAASQGRERRTHWTNYQPFPVPNKTKQNKRKTSTEWILKILLALLNNWWSRQQIERNSKKLYKMRGFHRQRRAEKGSF